MCILKKESALSFKRWILRTKLLLRLVIVCQVLAAQPNAWPPELILVNGGTFAMGCTAEQSNCEPEESPVHEVTLTDFYIGRYEITQAQYLNLVPEYANDFNNGEGATHPIYWVNWYEATTFCNRLSLQEGFTPVYYADEAFTDTYDVLIDGNVLVHFDPSADGFRLPTEAEWEYAARGGALSNGYLYSGSNDIDAVGWTVDNSGGDTQAVGSKQPNELGLYDMTGNVIEWCWDRYSANYYQSSPSCNPLGASGIFAAGRGGSIATIRTLLRVSARWDGIIAFDNYATLTGFRIARNPIPTTCPCPLSLGPDTTICQGETVRLSIQPYWDGNYDFEWSTGNTSDTTIRVTPLNPTEYWVNYTNSQGCTASDTILVEPIACENPCTNRLDGFFTLSPQPTNGSYGAGTLVNACFNVTSWEAENTSIWFHSLEVDFGPAWNFDTFTPNPPGDTGNNDAGVWAWYTNWTSCASGASYGPGFAYDSEDTGPLCSGTDNDGDPGNNYGDGPGMVDIMTDPIAFCWEIQVANDAVIGEDLSIRVRGYDDTQSGGWESNSNACLAENVPDVVLDLTTTCAMPLPPDTTICRGESVYLTIGPYVSGIWDFEWSTGNTTDTTLIVSPLVTTEYWVRNTDRNGCTALDTILIQVDTSTTNPRIYIGQLTLPSFSQGEPLEVPIRINNMEGVDSLIFTLTWNNLFDYESVQAQDLPGFSPANVNTITNGINVVWDRASGVSLPNGSILFNLYLSTQEPVATTPLTFTNVFTGTGGRSAGCGPGIDPNDPPNSLMVQCVSTYEAEVFGESEVCEGEPAFVEFSLVPPPWSGSFSTTGPGEPNTPLFLDPGSYSFTVDDGCTNADFEWQVNSVPQTEAVIITPGIVCTGDVFPIELQGLDPIYSVQWIFGAADVVDDSGLEAQIYYEVPGSYNIEAIYTDINGCEGITFAEIFVEEYPYAEINNYSPVCETADPFNINFTPAAPGVPFWSGAGITNPNTGEFDPAAAGVGTHLITLEYVNGPCVHFEQTEIAVVSEPSVQVVDFTNETCLVGNDGRISVQASGGTGAYGFMWSHDASLDGPVATGLSAGNYSITVMDDVTFCETIIEQLIDAPVPPELEFEVRNASCDDSDDGQINLTINPAPGATATSIDWNTGQSGAIISDLFAGVYIVTVTDDNACIVTDTALVYSPPLLTADWSNFSDDNCGNAGSGFATIQGAGGTPPYNYNWNHNATLNDTIANGLIPGTYCVTITDDFGCAATNCIDIQQDGTISFEAPLITAVPCDDPQGGVITINPVVPNGIASVIWDNGAMGTTISSLAVGTYEVTVTDQVGCEGVSSISVPTSNDTLRSSFSDEICGSSYNWAGQNYTTAGIYQQTFSSASGCDSVVTLTLSTVLGNTALEAQAGPDTVLCTPDFQLNANLPLGTTGRWTYDADVFMSNPVAPNALLTDLLPGDNTFTWTLSTTECPDYSSDNIQLTYVPDFPLAISDTFLVSGQNQMFMANVLDNDLTSLFADWIIDTVSTPSWGGLVLREDGNFIYTVEQPVFEDYFQYQLTHPGCTDIRDTANVLLLFEKAPGEYDGFTPNNDGVNDVFVMPELVDLSQQYEDNEVTIFNRWGQIVYYAKPYKNDWDGTHYQTGQPLPAGAYFYTLQLDVGEGILREGMVVIVR